MFRKTLAGLKEVAMLMRARYCRPDYRRCALYEIAEQQGRESVPEGLFPNPTGRAELIIRESATRKTSPAE